MATARTSNDWQVFSGYVNQDVEFTVSDDSMNVYTTINFPTYPNPGGTGFWRYMLTLQRWNGTSWDNVEQQTYNIACGQSESAQFNNIAVKGAYMHFWIDFWNLGSSLSNTPTYEGHQVSDNWIR